MIRGVFVPKGAPPLRRDEPAIEARPPRLLTGPSAPAPAAAFRPAAGSVIRGVFVPHEAAASGAAHTRARGKLKWSDATAEKLRGGAPTAGVSIAAAEEVMRLSEHARLVRSAAVALVQRAVPERLGSMTATELSDAAGIIEAGVMASAARRTAFNGYHRFFVSRARLSAPPEASMRDPLPVTHPKLRAFALFRVTAASDPRSGMPIQAGGLRSTLVAIRAVAEARLIPDSAFDVSAPFKWPDEKAWAPSSRQQWSVSSTEWIAVLKLADKLARALPSASRATYCFSVEDLRTLHDDAMGAPSMHGRRRWAYIATSVALQARGEEAAGLQHGDMHLDARGLQADMVLHKTNKASFRPSPRAAPVLNGAFGFLDASAALRAYLEPAGWEPSWEHDEAKRHWPVFCVIRHDRHTAQEWTAKAARADIASTCRRLGIADHFDMHFGRSSGATLYTELGFPFALIERIGGHRDGGGATSEERHMSSQLWRYNRSLKSNLADDICAFLRNGGGCRPSASSAGGRAATRPSSSRSVRARR